MTAGEGDDASPGGAGPTVAAIGESIARGTRRCRDWVETFIARIEALNPRLHAVITPTFDDARNAADVLDRELAAGRSRGPLHGVPFGLKDVFDTAGVRTTAGSRVLIDRVPTRDAAVVARLRACGAVPMGKLETVEFCLGRASDDGAFTPALNPWDAGRYAGGSSSGSGVAVAAGLLPFALGTDTAGSIRLPAAYCGATGFKPSAGWCDRRGLIPLSPSLDEIGPLALTVEDCALVAGTITGRKDWRTAPDAPGDLSGLRIGIDEAHFRPWASPAVAGAVDDAAARLTALGASIRPIALPDIRDFTAVSLIISMAEGFAIHRRWLATRAQDYTACTRRRIGLGAVIEASELAEALRRRAELAGAWARAFEEVDLILSSAAFTGAAPAADMGDFYFLETPLFGCAANVAGAPSIAVPTGLDGDGLPVAVQLSGPPGGDRLVLDTAQQLQRRITPLPPPPISAWSEAPAGARSPAGYSGASPR